jgi:hypothetical protein
LETKSRRIGLGVLLAALLVVNADCQTLAPVDISAFGKDHPLGAVLTQVSSSECRGAGYIKSGESHHDDLSYDIHVSAVLILENHSTRAVMVYKGFDPTMTQRVAASPADLASAKYVAGFDGDRMAIGSEPKKVSIDDFIVLKPGERYKSAVRTTVYASANPQKPLHTSGRYWVQLGIDARPDEFYFDGGAEKDFKRKWESRGSVVDFILAEPFPIDVTLDPKAPACKD